MAAPGRIAALLLCLGSGVSPALAQSTPPSTPPALPKAEYVTVKTDDGVAIQCLLQKPADGSEGKPAVLCIPVFNHPKEDYRSTLLALASQGMTGLAIDTRGTGGSYLGANKEDLSKRVREKDPALFQEMYRDANAAVAYLLDALKADAAKIVVIGASVGGSIAVHAASKNPKIAAVAWISPGESYLGLPTMEHLKDFGDKPLLLLAAQDEESKGLAQIVEARKGSAKTEKKVYAVTQAHGLTLFNKTGEASKDIFIWLRKQFGYKGGFKPTKS